MVVVTLTEDSVRDLLETCHDAESEIVVFGSHRFHICKEKAEEMKGRILQVFHDLTFSDHGKRPHGLREINKNRDDEMWTLDHNLHAALVALGIASGLVREIDNTNPEFARIPSLRYQYVWVG